MNSFSKHYISHNLLTQSVSWANRVSASSNINNGITFVNNHTLPVIDIYIKDICKANLNTKFNVLSIFADNISVCRIPLTLTNVVPAMYTVTNFTTANLTVNGLQGNGSGYLRTGITPSSAFTSTDKMMAFYCPNDETLTATYDLIGGVLQTTPSNNAFYAVSRPPAIDRLYSAAWNESTAIVLSSYSGKSGFYVTGRSGSNRIYRGLTGSIAEITRSTALGGTYPSNEIFFYNVTSDGIDGAYKSVRNISMMAIFDGMNPTQLTSFYTATYNCRRLLGGGYV